MISFLLSHKELNRFSSSRSRVRAGHWEIHKKRKDVLRSPPQSRWLAVAMGLALLAGPLRAEFVYITAQTGSNFTLSGYQVGEDGALTILPRSQFDAEPFQLAAAGQFLYQSVPSGDEICAMYQIAENGTWTILSRFFFGGFQGVDCSVAAVGRFLYATVSGTIGEFLIDPVGSPLFPVVFLGNVSSHVAGNEVVLGAGDPFARFFYVPNGNSNNVSAFRIAENGTLTELAASPFSAGVNPTCVAVDPFGRFAYVTNRGSNNVSAFKIDNNGTLTPVVGSPFPAGRNPAAVAVGQAVYVVNSDSNTVSVFQISDNGALTPVAGSPFTTGEGPISIAVGRFVYVLNQKSNSLSVYSIGVNGALAPVAGSPFTTPGSLQIAVAVSAAPL